MDKNTPTLETLKTYKVDLRKNIPVTGRAEVFSPIAISEDRITYR